MIAPDDVDLVNAHGTSTPVGDLCEVAAVNAVFGGRGKKDFKLNSTKFMLGHQLGASGALEAIACIMSIEKGAVHPTINHDDPEDGVDFDVVPNEAQDFKGAAPRCPTRSGSADTTPRWCSASSSSDGW